MQQGPRGAGQPDHRGACGCDPLTGDGAGMLMQIPHEFFAPRGREAELQRCQRRANTASGWSFCRSGSRSAAMPAKRFSSASSTRKGRHLLGWRTVPIDETQCGEIAHQGLPAIRQIFIGRGAGYRATKRRSSASSTSSASASPTKARRSRLGDGELFYVCSLSSSTLVYKGQLISNQIPRFYPDLDRSADDDRAGDGPSAVLDQYVSRAGIARIRIAFSRTTAKSIRCAAISTGCARARSNSRRRCSARTSRRFCRSSSPTAAIPRSSTIASNCWCARDVRCRMP